MPKPVPRPPHLPPSPPGPKEPGDVAKILEATNKILSRLATAIESRAGDQQTKEILHRIAETERKIMSAISDFAAKQKAFNDRQDAAVTGLQGDVKSLNDKIEELQNSPGGITPEDQALLDELEARGEAIATKLEALDALTPPTPPVA